RSASRAATSDGSLCPTSASLCPTSASLCPTSASLILYPPLAMTMRHTTGGTPPLSDLPAPPPRTTVVVHWGPLAAGAPVPHDRRVLRWILDRAHESTVWMVSLEPTIGSTVTPELDRAAVVTVATGVRTRQWLVKHRANIE